ncbi:uncharacterized protein [Spinacia oleracea]|uniref:CCHC-type domain-containing protein n=1 Tax=Spinacia oleracea TaxID=3562 RepID=A0A9R0JG90_SPIOL|nr:uncharacterized protein LOC110806059 [Spinacia oleracea]
MVTKIEPTSPLYLHPSDGSNAIAVEKLVGSANFRSWQRTMEISLASKRKLGFVTGLVKRDPTDEVKQEAWDTCNSMVISWIMGNVSESIKKSIMFVNSCEQIWKQLQQRYTVTNGSRKYKLNKEIYETKQKGKLISDYYTDLKVMWEELENLNSLPPITSLTTEINAFVQALQQQQEEQKLFQFLNGVDEVFGPQRSNILMMSTLPTVEIACSILQQEESQREVLNPVAMREETDVTALFSKSTEINCTACGKAGHVKEKCWTVVGYPSWHPKGQGDQKGKAKAFSPYNTRGGRWTRGAGRNGRGGRMAAQAQGGE